MAYTIHHVHIKAKDPRKSAKWWVDMFGARPLGERNSGGALFVPVELGGMTINITSPRPQDQLGPGYSGLHYGLEHIGVGSDDIERDLARFREQGLQIFETIESPESKIAFVEGPDDVRIELLQLKG